MKMLNDTAQHAIRHLSHKQKLLQQLLEEEKLRLSATPAMENMDTTSTHHSLQDDSSNCFSTNQVLVVIGVTCFLNFAFIILIMVCVQILGSSSKNNRNIDEDSLVHGFAEDSEMEHMSNVESAKIRLASLPDNIITRNIAARLLRAKRLKSKFKYKKGKIPVTYNFEGSDYDSDDDQYELNYRSNCRHVCHHNKNQEIQPRQYHQFFENENFN